MVPPGSTLVFDSIIAEFKENADFKKKKKKKKLKQKRKEPNGGSGSAS